MRTPFKLLQVYSPVCHPVLPSDKDLFEIDNDFHLCFAYKDEAHWISIPKRFQWDGASIPRFAWSILGATPGGAMLLPSVVHDALYRTKGCVISHVQIGVPQISCSMHIWSRKQSDLIFIELMKWCEEWNKLQIATCYGVLRAMGRKYWGGDAP